MADEVDDPKQDLPTGEASKAPVELLKTIETTVKRRPGIFSRIWNGLFRKTDDFEKKLQHISKEEASVHARLQKRTRRWRTTARNIISLSVVLEVVAVIYAVLTTRTLGLNWKMRALHVLPMFVLPGLSFVIYSMLSRFTRMRERKDRMTLERLRAERKAKLDELKERTGYYSTQQLIHMYDLDPLAKAAAASVLAHKLGEDAGLKVYVGDEGNTSRPSGKSNDIQLVQSSGLRNRRHRHSQSSSAGSIATPHSAEENAQTASFEENEVQGKNQPVVVGHYQQPTNSNEGWLARLAALLVGEDPTQSFALICGNCHMHNGLARKEDFPYITYYCPHCNALNVPQHQDGAGSGSVPHSIGALPSGDGGTSSKSHSPSGTEVGAILNSRADGKSRGSETPTNQLTTS
ncbi:uncharacterized protein At2g24330-like [Aristolochia californica]|uniref:uncharacterized protein At2g24330-like n=1 Tax=Aristolochia californica TaxID=171875 RepID=UPI0035E30DA9